MKFVSNAGSDRVLDLIRSWLKPEHLMDMVSPSFSLYAFSEFLTELPHLANARLSATRWFGRSCTSSSVMVLWGPSTSWNGLAAASSPTAWAWVEAFA